jgi:flagellar biosynthesis chaperone FliJ
MQENINWKLEEARAKKYSIPELLYAIRDAKEALECAEAMEKRGMISNAGKYADQISVYTMELKRKKKKIGIGT